MNDNTESQVGGPYDYKAEYRRLSNDVRQAQILLSSEHSGLRTVLVRVIYHLRQLGVRDEMLEDYYKNNYG
jgi:predicted metal-dependent phosphotriesterase family hydrolase